MLRVSAGYFKGRGLKGVSHPDVRPTMARVKLSFFDILQTRIKDTIFLDGFAGTGNIGIEALSRGAEYVVFVDSLPQCEKVIQHNLQKIGVQPDHFRIICKEFNRAVIDLAKLELKFDLIFLDPPYKLLEFADPLKVIFKRGVLKDEGLIVLERPTEFYFKTKFFKLNRSQQVGRKTLDFFGY